MIGIARANNAHKNEGYKKVIGTKLVKKSIGDEVEWGIKGVVWWVWGIGNKV